MLYHAYIKRAFDIDRYLREHEQTIWIAHLRSRERQKQVIDALARLQLIDRSIGMLLLSTASLVVIIFISLSLSLSLSAYMEIK